MCPAGCDHTPAVAAVAAVAEGCEAPACGFTAGDEWSCTDTTGCYYTAAAAAVTEVAEACEAPTCDVTWQCTGTASEVPATCTGTATEVTVGSGGCTCSDGFSADQASCEAAWRGNTWTAAWCSNGWAADQTSCEGAGETWAAGMCLPDTQFSDEWSCSFHTWECGDDNQGGPPEW